MSMQFEDEKQILDLVLSSSDLMARVRPILRPELFGDNFRPPLRQILEYYDAVGSLPPPGCIALAGLNNNIGEFGVDYMAQKIEDHLRYKAHVKFVLDSSEFVEAGDYDSIHKQIEEVKAFGNVKDDFGFLSGEEICAVEPPQFLIKPWLVKDTVSAVYGAPGAFKSFLTLDAGLSLATAPVGQRTSVCYVAAEGASGTKLRIEAWLHNHGVEKLAKDQFLLATRPVNLIDSRSVTTFIMNVRSKERAYGCHYGLLIIDTLSQCMPGADENAVKDVSVAVNSMQRIRNELGTTIIFVHHSGKDAAREMRGSSAIKGNTDAMIEVTKNDMSGTAVVKRQKDTATGDELHFDMVYVSIPRLDGQDIAGSLVCRHQTDLTTKLKARNELQQLADKLLQSPSTAPISVRTALDQLGKPQNTYYRKWLTDLLPLCEEIPVDMPGGEACYLKRIPSSKDNSKYGNITFSKK